MTREQAKVLVEMLIVHPKLFTDNTKRLAPVITAFADGQPIEFRVDDTDTFSVITNPGFKDNSDCYRIKPDDEPANSPAEQRDLWVVLFSDGEPAATRATEAAANSMAKKIGNGARVVRALVRE